MNDKLKSEIQLQRDYYIIKSNDLVRGTWHDLTLQEQKIVAYLIY